MKKGKITPARSYVNKKLKDKAIRFHFDEERTKTEIARMIRTAREKAGLSQRALAKRAETTQSVVARLELGTDSRMPSLMLIYRLLEASDAHLELHCVYKKAA